MLVETLWLIIDQEAFANRNKKRHLHHKNMGAYSRTPLVPTGLQKSPIDMCVGWGYSTMQVIKCDNVLVVYLLTCLL